MSEETEMIAEATGRIFADLADPQTLNAAKNDGWKAPLWQALEEAGLTRAWVPEEKGGAGIALDAGFEILRVSGHYASPVAIAETLVAGWAMAEAGLDVPDGPLTLGMMRARDRIAIADGQVSGTLRSVPFASDAAAIVVVADTQLAVLAPSAATVTPRETDMGGERADLRFDASTPDHIAHLQGGSAGVEMIGAVARACQMTGALESALALTTDYTGEREAFGRKIGKFQAVQQNLARLAGEVAAALTASGSAADTLTQERLGSDAAFLEVSAAKIRVGEAVETGVAIAHQAHGAIGWTQDYTLQRYTRRMMGWRDDFGSESHWAVRLGNHVASGGAESIWPMITTR
ncbi:MAG: acyl-CoA dehydrogenase family protein [Pseudomonadota bacterium]